MPDWATFAAATVVLTLLLLYLTRRSRRALDRIRVVDSRTDIALAAGRDTDDGSGGVTTGLPPIDGTPEPTEIGENPAPTAGDEEPARRSTDDAHGSTAVDSESPSPGCSGSVSRRCSSSPEVCYS